MRNLFKSLDKKFLISLMIIIAALSTFMAYTIYAQEVTDEMLSEGDGMANGVIGATDYLTLNDLYYRYPIFCCSKGTPLNGASRVTLVTEMGSSDPEVTGKLKPGDEGMKMFETRLEGENTETPFAQGTYEHRTYGEYVVADVKVATPKEAYILAEMINNLPNYENGGFKFIGEEEGQKIQFTDTDAIANASYIVVNDKTVYIIENGAGSEELVMQDEDGNYYYVEETADQGMGIYSYVQRAWWTTEAGGKGNSVGPNGLSEEATLFEAYIQRIAKSIDPSTFVEQEFEINGVTGTVHAPEIEYKPEFNTGEITKGGATYNLDERTVAWDSVDQEYKIGPFSLNYVKAGASVEGRNPIEFSGITNAELYTDASSEPLVRGEDWDFEWQIGQRTAGDTYEYPYENEVFYIRLKYKEDATKITNLKFDFKYMNAGGQYESLEGTYYNVTWTAQEKANWCRVGRLCSHGKKNSHSYGSAENRRHCGGGTACSHGEYRHHIESTDYWVELESFSSPITSQLLAGGLIGARWYETTTLELDNIIPPEGRLKIYKKLVDEHGNEIKNINENIYFDFKITVDGHGTERIRVKAGSAAFSKLYTWEEGEAPPNYTVEEIPKEGYEIYSIENSSGTLGAGQTITVLAKNKVNPKEGNIEIVKKVTDDYLNGRQFKLIVKVTGTFEYQGIKYVNQTLEIPEAYVTAGESWRSDTIKWYGEKAPTYVVDEVEGEDYEIKSITPKSGLVDSERTTKVTIINEGTKEYAKIRINKTLENADKLSEEYINSLRFTFEIKVDGYEKTRVQLRPIKTETGYEWNYISGKYYWNKGQNPTYTITEIDLPAGTEFVTANSPNGNVSVSGTTVTGTLVNDTTNNYTIINNIINRVAPKESHLEILKTVNHDSLVNQEYRFTVKVTGTFEYLGNYYENTTLYLTNDSATNNPDPQNAPYVVIGVGETKEASWISPDVFRWYGEAPKYSVEENLSGLATVKSVINPSQGDLTAGQTVKVIAENRINVKIGALHIIKKLENANNYSAEYIKSLVFKFRITVGGVDYGVVSLNAEKVNDDYIWEYRSEYTWDVDAAAPTYTIEEVELPAGTEFVSANSPNGNATVEGTKITGTLIPDSEDDFVIVNNFINKLSERTGNLKIEKKVTNESLNGVEFKFNVKLTGTFEYNGTVYTNDTAEINDVVVTGGTTWTSPTITWYGENPPTYEVTETSLDIAELVSVINGSGTLIPGGTAEAQAAIFTNKPKEKSGTIQITKKLEDGATSDQEFFFDITVDGYETYTVSIKAGETYRSQRFTWNASEPAPNYVIKERLSNGFAHISMTDGEATTTNGEFSGTLIENDSVNIICVNKLDKNSGKIRVTKEVIVDEKQNADSIDAEFTIQIVINGTFEMGDESVIESTRIITETIKAGGTVETPLITWYGDEAPTYTVTEISLPQGWKLENVSNANGQLGPDETVEVVVTNSLRTRIELDLTMEMAGHVWEDLRVENKESEQIENYGTQGIFDENLEVGIDGVEVYIYKVLYSGGSEVSRTPGTAYEDGSNTRLEFPIYTENGGYWSSPRMAVPALTEEEKNAGYTAAYDIEFIYDGQTYEPTDFLKTSNGDAASYRNASTAERDAWAKDSMALDYNREEVDNRIGEVYGYTPIDGQGNTIGKVTGDQTIYYESTDYSEGTEATRKISEVQTTDANGVAYDLFKAKARTSIGGLTYPFDNRSHLESIDKYIDDFGVVERYKYTATYNYTLNINLGLLKREEADLSLTKDLYSAKVVANEKLLNYKFNTLADLTGSTISRQLKADDMNISYELGLYKTDYYYRAEIYQTEGRVYDAVNTFYKSIGKSIQDTELDVYLTYKVKVYNESPTYIVSVNSINDYFDSSFGQPISEVETKYVKTIDGVSVESVTEVAGKSYAQTSSGNRFEVNWEVSDKIINGSDGTSYKKMTANFGKDALRLASGEMAEITVTFKVQKDDINGLKNAVILGQKSNVAEIGSYSTYYGDGRNAGKIDKDSAPDNANIEEYNIKSWYEDDTDSAPILNLKLTDENREIIGLAWEDKPDTEITDGYGQVVGNGVYDEGEALIGGLTTQLVEKVTVKNSGSETEYTEYDFLWPTNRPLDALGGKTLASLTGFDSTIETSRAIAAEDDTEALGLGEYKFTGVPVGNYVVRFLYGNDKTELEDSENITGDPTALKGDGTNYSENENILTANYDNDPEGRTPAIYNGQDYKTTTYQAGIANTDGEGYLNNDWHDLNQDPEIRLSDARDSEVRRLEAIANSEVITTTNGEVLATANDKTANHTDLYKDYWMFADTAKIKVDLEDLKSKEIVDTESLNNSNIPNGIEVKFVKGTVLKDGIAETTSYTYQIKNIDVGLEERSETAVVLDKQISSIKLITSDNNVIFNAMYDISYEEIPAAVYAVSPNYTKIAEKDGKYIVANVALNESSVGANVLQAINKVEDKDNTSGTQNFRFINVDEDILQGCTIEINYKYTALNVGETDRADSKLENISEQATANNTSVAEEILKAAAEVEKQNTTKIKPSGSLTFNNTSKIGSYLGTTYYQGANANGNDSIVTTTVRQLVDYVDNDAVFAQSYNNSVDHSWRNSTVNETFGNGYEAERLINRDTVREHAFIDKNDVTYITDQKNNVIVSIDNISDDSTLTNKGFEIELLPYDVDNTKYTSSIELTTTRTIAAETDADSLAFDNIAEIVKIENTVGRRDVTAVPGNANPRLGEFEVSLEERDASATELITLTPPTGIESDVELTFQILAVSAVSLLILVIGVIIIKKKVLTK